MQGRETHRRNGVCAQAAEGKRKRESAGGRGDRWERGQKRRETGGMSLPVFQSNTLGTFKNPQDLYRSPVLVIFYNSRVLSSLMLSH